MKPTAVSHHKKNIRLLILFVCFVVCVLLVSFVIRVGTMIRQSSFEGDLSYTLAFIHKSNVDIVVFHPQQKRLSQIQVRGEGDVSEKLEMVGVIPDARIYGNTSLEDPQNVKGIISDALFHKNDVKTDLNDYVLVRLLLLSQSIAPRSMEKEEIHTPVDSFGLDTLIQPLLVDQQVAQESRSITVVNATGVAGLGRYYERGIEHIGGNVISVENAEQEQEISSVTYLNDYDKTVTKLSHLLHTPATKRSTQGLSDIIVTIGKDRLQ